MESSKVKSPSPIEQIACLCLDAGMNLDQAEREFKSRVVMEALRRNRGNVCRTARALGHHRNTVGRIIQQLRLGEFANSCRPEATRRSSPRKPSLLLYADNRLDQSRLDQSRLDQSRLDQIRLDQSRLAQSRIA